VLQNVMSKISADLKSFVCSHLVLLHAADTWPGEL
jgi:hypothetical protein